MVSRRKRKNTVGFVVILFFTVVVVLAGVSVDEQKWSRGSSLKV